LEGGRRQKADCGASEGVAGKGPDRDDSGLHVKSGAGGRKDNKKSRDRGLSPTTVNMHHRILHKALDQAMKWRLITYNPADLVEPPRKAKTEKAVLDLYSHVMPGMQRDAVKKLDDLLAGKG